MKYYGFNALTGSGITDIEHLRQSVRDILMTPIGSRIARRTYGSLLFRLTDQPDNKALRLQLMSACYSALLRWEPRIQIQRLTISAPQHKVPHSGHSCCCGSFPLSLPRLLAP